MIERHKSTGGQEGVSTLPEIAPHVLLHLRDPASKLIKRETLDLHIFYDVSVIEVFVNDRVAITTRIYPESGKYFGLHTWAANSGIARLLQCKLWELKAGKTVKDGLQGRMNASS